MTDELSERDYERMLDTVKTASEWHGGQSSALYSYSSTGEIHGDDHKARLISELDEIERIRLYPRLDELDDACLAHLRYTVERWPNEAV